MNKSVLYLLVTLPMWLIQPAFAVVGTCPEINSYSDADIKTLNNASTINTYGQTIYFCKQEFSAPSLAYLPTATELLTGGSQALSQGSTQRNSPVLSSINLAGFTPSSLNLNTITAYLPNNDGIYNSPSLFNFYTRIPSTRTCDNYNGQNQYMFIKNYLRANASIFQSTASGKQTGIADSTMTTSIAKISNALLVNANNKTIPATIEFYHANDSTGQVFSRGSDRYCWLGVGTKLTINSNTANLTSAGNYKASLAVLTY